MPRALKRFIVRPVAISEMSAKGMESGSVERMISGWIRLSNWAASTIYMKIEARPMASNMLWVVSSSTLT